MTGGYSFPASNFQQNKWFPNLQNNNDLRLIIDTKKNKTIGTVILTNIDYKNGNAKLI